MVNTARDEKMVPSYDFDIYWAEPAQSARSYTAKFRDPSVVEALQGANSRMKQVFTASGFSLDVGQSALPAGSYSIEDEVARSDAVSQLARNIPKYRLRDVADNGFDLAAFVDHLAEAKAVGDDPLANQQGAAASFGRGAAFKAMRELGQAVLTILEPDAEPVASDGFPSPSLTPQPQNLRKAITFEPEKDSVDEVTEVGAKSSRAAAGIVWAQNASFTLALAACFALAIGAVLVKVPSLDGGHVKAAVTTLAKAGRSEQEIRAMQATIERQPQSRLNAGKGNQIIQSGGQMHP